jgi:hypothetical protein
MKRLLFSCLLLFASLGTYAANSDKRPGLMIYGGASDGAPGWAVLTDLPEGWTQDCCTYAKAIGVNAVLYQGEWTGKPERVMVLNVWTAKKPTLDADLDADRMEYLARDHAAQVGTLAVNNASISCKGYLYQGSDHFDDIVVFCDPGKASGIRLSWSMTVAASDPKRQELLSQFMRVATSSKYLRYDDKTGKPSSQEK